MWESPIEIITGNLRCEMEGDVLKAVQDVGVMVKKDDLIKAMAYDRNQYDKGCKDTIDKFVEKVELKYLGVHPDELHNPHYAYEIVNEIRMIAEQMKVEV